MNTHPRSEKIELLIAHLLRWGVAISFTIVTLGIFLTLLTGNTGYHSIQLDDLSNIIRYHPGPPEYPNSISDVIAGVAALKPYALIALGLLILIAIPILRVAVSIIAFALERDWVYVAITVFVLAALLVGFALGANG